MPLKSHEVLATWPAETEIGVDFLIIRSAPQTDRIVLPLDSRAEALRLQLYLANSEAVAVPAASLASARSPAKQEAE
jgi:hypothetical protein